MANDGGARVAIVLEPTRDGREQASWAFRNEAIACIYPKEARPRHRLEARGVQLALAFKKERRRRALAATLPTEIPKSRGDRPFWETPEFRRLQAHWYKVARQDGFDDVEFGRDTGAPQGDRPAPLGCLLKMPKGLRSVDAEPMSFAVARAAAESGRAALERDHLFRNATEREIWRLRYEEGLSLQEIADALNLTTRPVRRVLHRIRREMRL